MGVWRRLLLVPLIAFAVVGCSTAGKAAPDAPLGIVTFNLYHDKADWPKRRALIVTELRRLDPDVIVLQEVLQHESLRNQAEDLAEALGYHAWFASVDPAGNVRRYGNAILTRQPPQAHDWIPLRPREDARNAAFVRIDIGGRPLNIYATHPNYRSDAEGERMRRQQFADLLAFIERTAGDAPSIVAGDFNAASDRAEMAAMAAEFDNAYDRLHPGANADPRANATLNPHYFPDDPRRIDHVYLQRGALQPLEARIVMNREGEPGVWPSDHFGVYVRFAFSGKPGTP